MSEFKVLKEPVSYNHRLYQPGETLKANDEEMQGFVHADYVASVDKSSRKSSSKK